MSAVLQEVLKTYRELQSYSDSGIVTVEVESIGKKFSGEKKLLTGTVFATNFMRNALPSSATERHLFRYQFTSTGHFAELREDNLYFICNNHEGVFKRFPEEGISPCSSLAIAVADTAALSFAGSYYSASLLLAGIVSDKQWFFNRLTEIEVVSSNEQIHLRAKIKDGLVDLFIDSEQLTFVEMIVARPTSTARFVWQDKVLDGEINTRIFDQYRF